jgi:hypothetical protein
VDFGGIERDRVHQLHAVIPRERASERIRRSADWPRSGRPQGAPLVRSRARSVQGGASPLQVNLLRPVANRNCVAARRGGEQRKANRVVRSESKLDSAMLTGEPARERRSLYLCEQEAHDAEGLGVKAIMGGSWVVGDGRLWRDGTREARRPARRKKEKGFQGTALRKEHSGPTGSRLPCRSQSTHSSDETG